MIAYRFFGTTLASDFPFVHFPTVDMEAVDLTFTLSLQPPVPGEWKSQPPIYRSRHRTETGEDVACLYHFGDCEVLCFAGLADYFLQPARIRCHAFDPEARDLVELRLLGTVLTYWLERQGRPMLHASAVAVEDRIVAFLSNNGGGKSGLSAALMRAGCALVTDDTLPVEERGGQFLAGSSYPQMRMWPDEAAHFLGRWEDLALVQPAYSKRRVPVGPGGFGAFRDSSLPLACLYIVERRDGGPVEIDEVPPRDALIELVRHSFAPYLVEAAGLQPFRFDLFARLVQRVPIRRLRYPSGFERLPEVAEVLLRQALTQ